MSSPDFAQFSREVRTWPESEQEWRKVSGAVRRLVAADQVVIRIPQDGSVALELSEPDRPVGEEATSKVPSWIEARFESGSGAQLVNLPEDQPIRSYWVAPIGAAGAKGWIAAGLSAGAVLSGTQKSLLESVSERLSELWERQELKSQIAQRDQFLSIASHELKTPLTSIYGLIQLQSRMFKKSQAGQGAPLSPEKQLEFFRIVIRQCERLNELIDGLLDVSRIQNGRFSVDPSQSEVSSIVHETVSHRLRVLSEEAGVTIQLDVPEQVHAWVDPVRFEEVVTNLGMNAIRFSPEGGVVWIRLRALDGGGLQLSFRDQGPNVPEHDRLRIFQPFEKAQRTTRMGGLGLGLFISKQIAQLHGGDVRLAESTPGKGNLFVAEFPGRVSVEKSA